MRVHYITSTHTKGTRHKALGTGQVAILDPGTTVQVECRGAGCPFCENEKNGVITPDMECETLVIKHPIDVPARFKMAKPLKKNNLADVLEEILDD